MQPLTILDPDGIVGPLIIDGPSTTEFDEDKGPLMLTDWYHKGAFSIYYIETGQGPPPQPQSVLINGMGAYSKVAPNSNNTLSIFACEQGKGPDGDNCKPLDAGMYSTFIEYGKKYKLRIINTSTTSHFSFWIEGHDFTIVATDFVPIEPYQVSYVNVAIGESSLFILIHIINSAGFIQFQGRLADLKLSYVCTQANATRSSSKPNPSQE